MNRRLVRGCLLLLALCSCTALVGCAEVKGASNSPARTQRPTGFYGSGQVVTTAPATKDRPRAMDPYLRGKRVVKPGPRAGDVRDNPVQPVNGTIAAPPSGNLDAAFDNTEAPRAPGRYHRMAKGENLWAVARRYGVTVDEIVRANHMTDPEHVPVGTRIFIPGEVAVRPATVAKEVDAAPEREVIGPARSPKRETRPGQGAYHVVKDGDTVSSLARFYGVPAAAIRQWNASEVSAGLPVGATLFIPGGRAGGRRLVPESAGGAKPQKVVSFRPRVEPAGFQWPIKGTVISKFGMRNGRPHTGLDIAAEQGVTIRAAMAGKVIYSGQMNGYGNVVILDHQNGYFTVYGHNQKNLVAVDRAGPPRILRAGEPIGTVGMTGNASRPHVHFEIRRSNDALDPLTLLQRPPVAPMASRASQTGHGE